MTKESAGISVIPVLPPLELTKSLFQETYIRKNPSQGLIA
jgi:hypothetical protein